MLNPPLNVGLFGVKGVVAFLADVMKTVFSIRVNMKVDIMSLWLFSGVNTL